MDIADRMFFSFLVLSSSTDLIIVSSIPILGLGIAAVLGPISVRVLVVVIRLVLGSIAGLISLLGLIGE